MSTKQEIVFDAPFKAQPFLSDFNFGCRYGRVTTATCKYYCPLVVSPTITNCCKELHFKYGRAPRSIFENVAMHENQFFFYYYFKIMPPLLKVISFFSVTIYSMMKYFCSAFQSVVLWIQSMVNKVKVTCKKVNFIKK